MFVLRNPVAGLATALTLTAATVLTIPQAAAQQCVERNELVEKLGGEFAEAQKAIGLAGNGTLIELFASPTGSWTLVTTAPTGESCPIAAGEQWSDRVRPAMAQLDWKF